MRRHLDAQHESWCVCTHTQYSGWGGAEMAFSLIEKAMAKLAWTMGDGFLYLEACDMDCFYCMRLLYHSSSQLCSDK